MVEKLEAVCEAQKKCTEDVRKEKEDQKEELQERIESLRVEAGESAVWMLRVWASLGGPHNDAMLLPLMSNPDGSVAPKHFHLVIALRFLTLVGMQEDGGF